MTGNNRGHIRSPRVFISYARLDGEDFARELVELIEGVNIPVWLDRERMRGGRDWWGQIDEVLDKVEYMVVVMTPAGVKSPTVLREWDLAREKGVCIYPVIAKDGIEWEELPPWMAREHCYDFEYQKSTFLNDLNVRCERIRVPFMATRLPENHVSRPSIYDELIKLIIPLSIKTKDKGPVTVALRGGGGFGKTALARELCHDKRTRYAYHQGILWVSLGEEPITDQARRVEDLVFELSGKRPGFLDATQTSHHLRDLLRDRNILIVIDDVWRESDASLFLVGGPGCAHLITTRNRETLPRGCKELTVNEMYSSEALALLGDDIPQGEVIKELSDLGELLGRWPILLSLVNCVLVDRVHRRGQTPTEAIRYANSKLDHYGLTAFDRNSSESRDAAVEKTVAISLDLLSEGRQPEDEDRVTRFEELAVFPQSTDIPIAAVQRMWGHDKGFLTTDLCERLYDYSLLQHFDVRKQTIRLHDIMSDYLNRRTEKRWRGLHIKLLESYRESCDNQWERLKDDKYIHKLLAVHLYVAGPRKELFDLIRPSWRAVQERIAGSGRAFANDISVAIHAAMNDSDLTQLLRLCFVRSNVYSSAAQVPATALGCLVWLDRFEVARDMAAIISDVDSRARSYISIATALATLNDDRANEIFALALETAEAIRSARVRRQCLDSLTRALFELGRSEEALNAAETCVSAAIQSEYAGDWDRIRAADLMLHIGNKARATDMIKEAAEKARTIKEGVAEWVIERLTMVDVLRRMRETKLADELVAPAWEMIQQGPDFQRPDGVTVIKFTVNLDLLELIARLGRVELALSYKPSWRTSDPAVRCTVAKVLLEQGDEAQATELHRQVAEDVKQRLEKYDASQFRWMERKEAVLVLEALLNIGEESTAENLAMSFKDMKTGAEALAIVAQAKAVAGRNADARRLLDSSLESAYLQFQLDVVPLQKLRTAVLQTLPTSSVEAPLDQWTSDFDPGKFSYEDCAQFATALARHDTDLAIEVFERCWSWRATHTHAETAMVEFASALSDVSHPDAGVWARRAVDKLPERIENRDPSVSCHLKVLSKAASVIAVAGNRDCALEWIDRVIRFFDEREDGSRWSEELDVWQNVLVALLTLGQTDDLLPTSDRIEIWSPSCVRRKVEIMRDIASRLLDVNPEISREAYLIAARTALMMGELLTDADVKIPELTGKRDPVLASLMDESRSEAEKIRKNFYPSTLTNHSLEVLLSHGLASAALSEIEPSTAAGLAGEVLQSLGFMVMKRLQVPVSKSDHVGVQADVVGSIVKQILVCCQMVDEDDFVRALPILSYQWVVLNAEAYQASPKSASSIYMAGAHAFQDNGDSKHACNLFAHALLATSSESPGSVLGLVAKSAEILAAIDDGKSLWRGMELINSAK